MEGPGQSVLYQAFPARVVIRLAPGEGYSCFRDSLFFFALPPGDFDGVETTTSVMAGQARLAPLT